MEKTKVLVAAQMAAASDPSLLTCDRIEALTGGHGMLNIAIHTVCDVLAEELLRGGDLTVKFADVRHLPMEDIMAKCINSAKQAGCDPANAALIVASIMYLCGSSAQVGIPAGNRKLGATARMIAGAARCGVAAMPTPKMNSKISGFAAVAAIYRAMDEGTLCAVDGRNVTVGGALYGHSALGEDVIWPELARNGARIGTEAMLRAMAGVGVSPSRFVAAIFGAAAILEIIHPDAEVPEEMGTYGRTSSAYLVGKSAAETAGLPAKLTMNITGEEYDTAKVIGDIGLILKDVGGVSVIGMMAFDEIFASFKEGVIGASGRPCGAPLGHIGGYAVVALKALLEENADPAQVAKAVAEARMSTTIDPESAMVAINLIVRKAINFKKGPVTRCLLAASNPLLTKAIYERAVYAYDMLEEGKTVEEIVKSLDDKRVSEGAEKASALFTKMFGKEFIIKMRRVGKGARRTTKLAKKYLAFDPIFDLDITVDGTTHSLDGYVNDIAPRMAKNCEFAEIKPYTGAINALVTEIAIAGYNIVNIVVPAAVAAAKGDLTCKEAAAQAELGAYVSGGVPGGKAAAEAVAIIAKDAMEYLA